MLPRFDHRIGHYLLLTLVWSALCLPHLGGPSLWDIDEGNNAQCAREMYDSGNYVVPTFNGKLRVDKPALLYWLQAVAYRICGVNEFAARLPSALAALLSVLATYELGRRLFDRSTALLGGLVLAGSVAFCAAAHFANPDALLLLFSLLSLLCFWNHCQRGGWWLLASGAAAGFAMLAKGPVGLILPLAAEILYLLWRRQVRILGDWRVLGAALVFLLVAAPWYVWVSLETKGEWLTGFLWKHNLQRGLGAMENHGGPFFYYALVLIAGLAPWSVFVGPTAWYAWKRRASGVASAPRMFLLCCIAVWLLFFTAARTKLPNYILPMYPAVALLTATFLDDWRRGRIELPAWVMPVSLSCLVLMGVGVSLVLLVAGDVLPVRILHGRRLPGLAALAVLGGVLIVGAAAAGWCLRRRLAGGLIASVAATGIAFAGTTAFWGADAVDRLKAPRLLSQALPEDQLRREVRVGAIDYFQPSLVFYCQREVYRPENDIFALVFLRLPLPVYLFVPAEKWEQLKPFVPVPYRLVARHGDLYTGREILLLTNEPVK